ncbi:hypothetical protein R69608_05845 [Paraburkholderia nemoris]|jgi:hypothetical protein|uniref:Uncharacterized protein n=1 Tax=Paraburkholderia nemoris TaxID=2793076 RepID=A0ABM8SID8_9BURK|nr:hypothetical protein LMG22931_05890 [Paraburkholderia nemoris]CAE6812079.1 hypothetical protein R69776_05727 [Paraburkholderia nemoris]CAE6951355.1 hypothetical protein R69608_05845 [Paraburkholderia nemoris]
MFRMEPVFIKQTVWRVCGLRHRRTLGLVEAIPEGAQPVAHKTLHNFPDQLLFRARVGSIRKPAHHRFQPVLGEPEEHFV